MADVGSAEWMVEVAMKTPIGDRTEAMATIGWDSEEVANFAKQLEPALEVGSWRDVATCVEFGIRLEKERQMAQIVDG